MSVMLVVLRIFLSFDKSTNIFKVPEVPKKMVPEKKISVPVPKKLKPSPPKGTCQHKENFFIILKYFLEYFVLYCLFCLDWNP